MTPLITTGVQVTFVKVTTGAMKVVVGLGVTGAITGVAIVSVAVLMVGAASGVAVAN